MSTPTTTLEAALQLASDRSRLLDDYSRRYLMARLFGHFIGEARETDANNGYGRPVDQLLRQVVRAVNDFAPPAAPGGTTTPEPAPPATVA